MWALIIAGLGIRLYRLTHQSLWTDEIVTFLSSRGSLEYVLTQRDINSNIPPLYYLIVHLTLGLQAAVGFVNRDAALRLPSVLFGVLTIPLTVLTLRSIIGRRGAFAAAVLVCFSPLLIWYSQGARPYALLVMLSLVALWCWQRALERPTSIGLRAIAAVAAAAVAYCHTTGIAFIGFLLVYALMVSPRSDWRSWLATGVVIGVLLIPAAWRLLKLPPTHTANDAYAFNPVHLVYTVWTMATGYSLGPSVAELHLRDRVAIALHYVPLIVPILLFLGGLCVYGAHRLRQENRRAFLVLLVWFLLPLGFAVAGSLLTVHPFNVRYAILSHPPFLASLALGVDALARAWVRWCVWLAIAVVSATSLYNYFHVDRYAREDIRGAAQYLADHRSAGDLVIVSVDYMVSNLQYYGADQGTKLIGYPPTQTIASARLPGDMTHLIGDRKRFWLFLSRTYETDPEGHLLRYCDRTFRRLLEFSSTGVRLFLYERQP